MHHKDDSHSFLTCNVWNVFFRKSDRNITEKQGAPKKESPPENNVENPPPDYSDSSDDDTKEDLYQCDKDSTYEEIKDLAIPVQKEAEYEEIKDINTCTTLVRKSYDYNYSKKDLIPVTPVKAYYSPNSGVLYLGFDAGIYDSWVHPALTPTSLTLYYKVAS